MKIALTVAALACMSLAGVAHAKPTDYFSASVIRAPAGSETFARKQALVVMRSQAFDLSREADAYRLLREVQSAVTVMCSVNTPNTPLSMKISLENACVKRALRAATAAVNHPQVDLVYASWR